MAATPEDVSNLQTLGRAGFSPWAALRHSVFRAIWIASVVSNIGTWMQSATASWLMAAISPTPVMVALMQTAASLPFFLLALPAGALADIFDRRRLLLWAQAWMLLMAAGLGGLTIAGHVTPWSLLALTFALGVGAAVAAPAWQAITPELVPRQDLGGAVALGGVSVNIARAVGPALGGLLVAGIGPGAVFLVNAVSFVFVMIAVALWRRQAAHSPLPPEHVIGAMNAGVRYVRHAPEFRAVLLRAAVFILPASCLWALLPLIARQDLGLSAVGYGLLLGALGFGAVLGTLVMGRLQARLTADQLVGVATFVFALCTAVLGFVHVPFGVGAALIPAGLAWITSMSMLTTAAQTAVPGWVRARALAVSMLVIQGGLALGSLFWGWLAAGVGTPWAFAVAAAVLPLGLLLPRRHRLQDLVHLDLTPTAHWPEPRLAEEIAHERGPVLVSIEYHIDPADAAAFTAAMEDQARVRRRDGAFAWGLFRDTETLTRYTETFLVESWAEHLRQHHRITAADRTIEDAVRVFHRGESPPRVRHLLAVLPS